MRRVPWTLGLLLVLQPACVAPPWGDRPWADDDMADDDIADDDVADDDTADDDTGDDDTAADDDTTYPLDADGDGYSADDDCDDAAADVHPGATEICDFVDNDCDEIVDEGFDSDFDGVTTCGPDGIVGTADDDCDDGAADVYPDATELCDGVDNDCDGVVDGIGLCGVIDLAAADAKLLGEMADDEAGLVISSAGDVNGDGYDDLLVGAQREDAGGDAAGAAYLVLSPVSGTLDLSAADAKLVGETADDFTGNSVSSAGDVNGDGFDDLFIGAYREDTGGENAGAAYLVLSPVSGTMDLSAADAKLIGETAADRAGLSVSSAGDVNGDGYDDLLVGAPNNAASSNESGAAYLVLGPVTGTVDLSAADAKLAGEATSDFAGYSVSSAGDVNNDGFDDLLVGAYDHDAGGDSAGAAYLVIGPVAGPVDLSFAEAKLVGEMADDRAGYLVSSAGDVNGDGFADLLVGAYAHDAGGSDAGAAYLVLGPVSGTVDLSAADAKFVGETSTDHAGRSVSSAGDVNGDGYDDLLVGAMFEDTGDTSAGAAYLVLGPVSGTVDLSAAVAKLVGETFEDYAGCSVSSAGDVDGDGLDDLLIGAYGNDEGDSKAGAVYLALGQP